MSASRPPLVVIRQAGDLQRLLGAGSRRGFRLELPDLTPEDNQRLERRLRPSVYACGCPEGTVGLTIGIATGIATWALRGGVSWAALVGLPIALAVAGKLFGLWRARRQFRRAVAEAESAEGKAHAFAPAGS